MSTPTSITLKGRAYRIRTAVVDDAATIARHRQRVFVECGRGGGENLVAMADAFAVWLRRKLRAGRYIGWFAEHNETIVAGVGVLLVERPPHPAQFGPLRGYVMNAYTERAHRSSGVDDFLLRLALARAQVHSAVSEPAPFLPVAPQRAGVLEPEGSRRAANRGGQPSAQARKESVS